MTRGPLPVLKALLVCDQVIQDAQSGKKSLIGVFHELRAQRFPATHPMLWIYANLTDAHGRYAFEIRMLDVTRNQVLGKGEPPPFDIQEPLQVTELAAQLRNVSLPGPGTYEFQLLSNGELLGTKAIHVKQIETPAET
jgi:hypothetical protein